MAWEPPSKAKQEAEKAKAEGKSHPGVPEDRAAQRNFTDPDSRIMPAPGDKEFLQAYPSPGKGQAAVDSAHQVIVAADVTNQPSDKSHALPMIKEVRSNTGSLPKEVSADAGYFSASAIGGLYALGVDPFIPPDKTRHGNVSPPALPGKGQRPEVVSHATCHPQTACGGS
ncbi:MAG: transposase [Chloroflexota bacterium]